MNKPVAAANAKGSTNGRTRANEPIKDIDLTKPSLYINRELSHIEFNRRVLHECYADHPLLERVKFLAIFTSESGINRTGFSHERYDEIMLRLAPSAADRAQRMALMHEAETLLMEALPVVPLYTYNSKHLVQPSVKGAPANVLDLQNFKYVSLDPDAPVWKGEG